MPRFRAKNRGIARLCRQDYEEHYNVRHGTKKQREAYYAKHPERRGKIIHIEDEPGFRPGTANSDINVYGYDLNHD